MRTRELLAALALAPALLVTLSWAAGGPAYIDEKKAAEADPDFAIQGEYAGEVTNKDGQKQQFGVQVVALGKGKFQAAGYAGGLPGDGGKKKASDDAKGETKDGETVLLTPDKAKLIITDGSELTVISPEGKEIGTLKKVLRESETLGKEPPEGAKILFGKDTGGNLINDFAKEKVGEDGLLMQGVTGKSKAQSFTIHLEFLLPYMPEARGQGRGNSGYYAEGRYEIQMLDSFGLEGLDNECGGIYSIARPQLNMCYPPLRWQTYDVDFTAPVYEGDKKVKNARITVRHNGVVIHDDLELVKGTPGGPLENEGPTPGPVHLQDHGDPVRYRNIWVIEK